MIRAVADWTQETREPFWASANLCLPCNPVALAVLAHNEQGELRKQLRRQISEHLAEHNVACCTVGLTNADEHVAGRMILDVETLADRMRGVVEFMSNWQETQMLPMALFGEDYCAAAVLIVASEGLHYVKAVGTYCGRPDLARIYLSRVEAPTLLVVPGRDRELVERNEQAFAALVCASQIAVIGNATRRFCETGAAHACRYLIGRWCESYVAPCDSRAAFEKQTLRRGR